MIGIISTRRPEFCTLKLVALNNINLLGLKVTYVWASSGLRKIASLTSRGFCVFQSGYQNVSPPHQILNTRVPEGPWKVFHFLRIPFACASKVYLKLRMEGLNIFFSLIKRQESLCVCLSVYIFIMSRTMHPIDFTRGGCCCRHKGVQFCILVQYGHDTFRIGLWRWGNFPTG